MLNIKRILRMLALAALVIVAVFACCMGMILYVTIASDSVPDLVFVNHSGQDVLITIHGNSFQVQRDGSIETPFVGETPVFRITTSKNEDWIYEWAPLGGMDYRFHNRIYLQIEPDGQLYVLPIQVNSPLDHLPSQPVGYPLKPNGKARDK